MLKKITTNNNYLLIAGVIALAGVIACSLFLIDLNSIHQLNINRLFNLKGYEGL